MRPENPHRSLSHTFTDTLILKILILPTVRGGLFSSVGKGQSQRRESQVRKVKYEPKVTPPVKRKELEFESGFPLQGQCPFRKSLGNTARMDILSRDSWGWETKSHRSLGQQTGNG